MQSIFFKFLVDCPNGLIELTEKSFNTVVISEWGRFAGHTYYLFFCHSVEKHRLDSSNVLPAERTLSVPLMDLTRALAALTGMSAR